MRVLDMFPAMNGKLAGQRSAIRIVRAFEDLRVLRSEEERPRAKETRYLWSASPLNKGVAVHG
jgi:hypothetical protein